MADKKEYIERGALGIGKANRDLFDDPKYADGWNSAIEIIETAPAADVVEVKHGEIVETIIDGKMNRVFSCCGKDFTQLTQWIIPNYCPNCGAKMDGERKDNP